MLTIHAAAVALDAALLDMCLPLKVGPQATIHYGHPPIDEAGVWVWRDGADIRMSITDGEGAVVSMAITALIEGRRGVTITARHPMATPQAVIRAAEAAAVRILETKRFTIVARVQRNAIQALAREAA